MGLIKTPKWIICFGDHWGYYTMGSPGNIMQSFNEKGYKILWINPIPKTNLSLSKVKGKKKVFFSSIIRKLKLHLKYLLKFNSTFYILTPIYFPIVESKIGKKFNPFFYKIQISFISEIFGIKNFAVCNFTSNPIYNFINLKKASNFFHIAADMHSDLRTASFEQKALIMENEAKLFQLAEKIFPASERIRNKIIEKYGFEHKIFLLPHGVDFYHFSDINKTNLFLETLKRPIIGYFGSLTFANDLEIFEAIAESGYTFVLIGEIMGDYSDLKKFSNVHFLGPVAYVDLPSYAQYFDVCIMAWKPSEWILNSNPKKTLEYLALGKPIVSVTIPHLKNEFSDFVYFGDEPEEFVKQIYKAISEDSDEKRLKRKKFAEKQDWNMITSKIERIFGWIK